MKHVQIQVCRSKATVRLSVSSEMSELLQCTRLPYLSNLQSHRLILLTQDQEWAQEHQKGSNGPDYTFPTTQEQGCCWGYLRSSYCILMAPNSLVATLVVLVFGGNLPYRFRLSTNIIKYHRK